MKRLITLVPLGLLGVATHTRAAPVVPCAAVTVYATVTDPRTITFASDGTLYVGRDNSGSGGAPGDAVKIHPIGPRGSLVVTETNFVVTNAVNSPARNFRLRKS